MKIIQGLYFLRFKLITQVSFQKAFTRIIQSIFIIVTADRG